MDTEPGKDPPVGVGAPYTRRASRGTSMWYMGCLFTVLAASEDTGGRFGLLEMVLPKGREPSRHLHRRDDEGFYVLEGNLTFYVGEEVHEAGPGAFVFLPHGVPHSYTLATDEVRMLGIVAPGGLEGHFRDPRFAEPAESQTLPLLPSSRRMRRSSRRWPRTWRATTPRSSALLARLSGGRPLRVPRSPYARFIRLSSPSCSV